MLENITSQQGLEILDSLKNHEFIPVDGNNIDELENTGLIHGIRSLDNSGVIQINLEEKKREFQNQLEQYNNIKTQYIQISRQKNETGYWSEFIAPLGLGRRRKLQRTLSSLMKQIHTQEERLIQVKKELLGLITQRDGDLNSVQFENKNYRITPKGSDLIREIKTRPRFFDRSFNELLKKLDMIDQNFQNQLEQVQSYISGRQFSPILLPYLANLDQLHLVYFYDRIGRRYDPYYDRILPEERIIKSMVERLYDIPMPSGLNMVAERLYQTLKRIMGNKWRVPAELKIILRIVTHILISWAYFHTRTVSDELLEHPLITRVISNLKTLLNVIFNRRSEVENPAYADLKFSRRAKTHTYSSLFLLALADDPSKFNYFYPKVNHGLKGSTYFASALTLLPYSAEETWLMLKRAEKHVLASQSVQFIPELLEYSIILNFNPNLLQNTAELNELDLIYWKSVILPLLATIDVFSLNEEISSYVNGYPLAYITNPRPYYYYYGYYRRPVYYIWWGRGYHRRYYYHRYHPAYARPTYTRPAYPLSRGRRGYSGGRLISGTRGVGSPGRFGGGSRGSLRGTRYSSLHHHTIG